MPRRSRETELETIRRKLRGFDERSANGAWTHATLDLIAQHPALRAVDVAKSSASRRSGSRSRSASSRSSASPRASRSAIGFRPGAGLFSKGSRSAPRPAPHRPSTMPELLSEHRLIDLGPSTISARVLPARRGSLPTLMFLHEGLGSLTSWRDIPDCSRKRPAAAPSSPAGAATATPRHVPGPGRRHSSRTKPRPNSPRSCVPSASTT